METQNITLAIPKKTLQKIKVIAAKQNSSISRLVTDALEKLANEETNYAEARDRQLKLVREGLNLGYGNNQLPERDELHERG
ncbi:MAG: DUF6364 family protein [Anaerolineales bacterium]|jgi:hypothetical protein